MDHCLMSITITAHYGFDVHTNTNISIKTFPLYICRSQLNAFIYIINILQLNKRRSTSKIIDL